MGLLKRDGRVIGAVIAVFGLAMAGFHLYTAATLLFPPLIQRSVHLLFSLVIGFLAISALRKERDRPGLVAVDLLLAGTAIASLGYLVWKHNELMWRPGRPLPVETVLGTVVILLVLELGRRAIGWVLPAIALTGICYALLGPYMPSFLAHRGVDYDYLVYYLYQTTEGIFGVPIGTTAKFIYIFVLFGTLLFSSGAGKLLIDLANGLAGRMRGGPAKVSVMASAFFGSVSGSSVANVVTTGSFTIPLMKTVGYSPAFAGAIEAAASTGGQLMPPVMGAAAFLMAEMTSIPYLKIVTAALIPAILYYAALLFMVDLRAARLGLKGMTREEIPDVRASLRTGWPCLFPLIILVYLLVVMRLSPMKAGFWAIVAVIPSVLLSRESRSKALKIAYEGILRAGRLMAPVVSGCALAGIVIASLNVSGLSSKFTSMLVSLAGESLPALLVLTGVSSFVLGMGVSAVVAYILPAVLMAPVLVQMGVPVLAAHLYVFYWSILAHITPPVALAAFAAAGIAEANPFKTGFAATKLGFGGFLVPFFFVASPTLLLIGAPAKIVVDVLSALFGIYLLALALEGWLAGSSMHPALRALLLGAALLGLHPGMLSNAVSIAVFVLCFVVQKRRGSGPLAFAAVDLRTSSE